MRAKEPVEQGWVERDGVRIHFEIFGDGEETMVFLPPWSIVHSRVYKGMIPYFSDRYRCIGERFEAQHESAAAFDRAMAGLRPMPYERKPLPPQCLDRVGAESRRSCPACRRQLSAQRRLIIDAIRGGLLGPQAVWQGGRRSEIVPERESAAHRVRTISAVLISMGRN